MSGSPGTLDVPVPLLLDVLDILGVPALLLLGASGIPGVSDLLLPVLRDTLDGAALSPLGAANRPDGSEYPRCIELIRS